MEAKRGRCEKYEIAFTSRFKDGLKRLPREIYPIIDRQLQYISADPFAKNPNATRMKNAPSTFRVRIGLHTRMLYRVFSQACRAEIVGIGPRSNVYESGPFGGSSLPSDEIEAIRKEIAGTASRQKSAQPATKSRRDPPDMPIMTEELNWISEDELFLLQIPHEQWPAVIKAGTIENLVQSTISEPVRALIEDYWSNPQPTQVERLYALSDGQDAAAIAGMALSHFLVALDPEQRQALQRIKDDGPYLLKGSAGTGKSLVGLYHVRDVIYTRAAESMFDEGAPWFGIVTYNNTLVDANLALLRNITPSSTHRYILCRTLDKIAFHLVKKALGGSKPSMLSSNRISKLIKTTIIQKQDAETAEIVERLGFDYVAEEIEQLILGNAIETLEEYVGLERRGRKRGLREPERKAIWSVFRAFVNECEKHKWHTWESLRILARKYLESHPEHPRFNVLFVDEAQDFSKVAKQLCLALIRDPRHLLLAADTGQSIYTIPISWRQTDPRFDFRRRRPITLERGYRASRQISEAIAPLRADPGDELDSVIEASPVFSGPKPRWIEADIGRHAAIVSQEISKLIRGSPPVNPGQIAIIVRDNERINRYQVALSGCGISSTAIAKGQPIRIEGKEVHIVTAHSSKGLGFPIVFVPEVQQEVYPWSFMLDQAKDAQQREQIEEKEQRLLYVALSRASHRLVMLVDPEHPSPFVTKLNRNAHWG